MRQVLLMLGTLLAGAAAGAGVGHVVQGSVAGGDVAATATPVLLAVCIGQLAALRQSVEDLRAAVLGRGVAPVVHVDAPEGVRP